MKGMDAIRIGGMGKMTITISVTASQTAMTIKGAIPCRQRAVIGRKLIPETFIICRELETYVLGLESLALKDKI